MSSTRPDKRISAEEFINDVRDTLSVSMDEISQAIDGLPPKDPLDAQAVAKALINTNKITRYQAKLAYLGRVQNLVIGDYLVLDRIGEGGMGQVFKAKHQTMDRIVALKLLHRKLVNSPEAVKRFQQEVRAAARLMHTNVVSAFDAGQHKGSHYLVMEFVDGKDLSSIVREDGELSIADAINCILQAAEGVAYAHKQGIIHRDIKPANLLLAKDGTVKVLDLGLARMAQDVPDELTKSGQIMGTLEYMAPEQARETKEVDARCDIYSLGCTIYKLLTGEAVYPRDTSVATMMAHQSDPIPSLLKARPDVPVELETLFQRMIAKTPEDRPQSMTEVLETLGQLSHGASTSIELQARIQQPVDDDLSRFFSEIDKRDTTTQGYDSTLVNSVTERHRNAQRQSSSLRFLIGLSGVCLIGLLIAAVFIAQQREKTAKPEKETKPATKKHPSVSDREIAESTLRMPLSKISYYAIHNDIWRERIHHTEIRDDGPIRLTEIIGGPKPKNESEWRTLSQLKHLRTIDLPSQTFDFSDKDAEIVASLRWPALTWLSLYAFNDRSVLTDAGIKDISGMGHITRLYLGAGSLTDNSLAYLLQMKQLKHLTLWADREQFTIKGYETLATHPTLDSVDLIGIDLDDAKLAKIIELKNLTTLSIRATITPKGLECLQKAPGITCFRSSSPDFGVAEMDAVASHAPNLTKLEIHYGQSLTNDALLKIGKLKNLEEILIADGLKLTNAGLLNLKNLPKLRVLFLKDISPESKIDAGGIAKLVEESELPIDVRFIGRTIE